MPPSRREDLIESAIDVFVREGFRSVSVDRVITESGLSRMTLYNHFDSKEDLVAVALERWMGRARSNLRERVARLARGAPGGRYLAVFDAYGEALADCSDRVCLGLTAAVEYDDPACRVRELAAAFQAQMLEDLEGDAREAGAADAGGAGLSALLLVQGAIAATRSLGQVEGSACRIARIWSTARSAASAVLESSRAGGVVAPGS